MASIDERTADNPDEMPLTDLLRKAAPTKPGEIVELITTHLPAPGIDIMKKKGYLAWSLEETPELIRTFFSKAQGA